MEKQRIVRDDGSYKEISTDQQSSIEISKNAKGEYSYKIKYYHDDFELLEEGIKRLKDIAEKTMGI